MSYREERRIAKDQRFELIWPPGMGRGLDGYRNSTNRGRSMNVEVSLLSVIAERLRYTALRPRILLLSIAAAALTAVLAPGQTLGQALGTKPLKLTVAQKKIVRRFEKQLTTPLNSKDNPGDRDTWYVIVFTDAAFGAKKSRFYSGNTRTTTYAWHETGNSAVKMTQGRKNAALLLLQYFYYTGNAAASRLQPEVNGKTLRAGVVATKNWRYRAFAKKEEAKTLFDLLNPKKKGKRANGRTGQ